MTMGVLSRPIPPLYVVYILRSTVRHASFYIGSTPHPPRRLKQHNGEAPRGAARTARSNRRPWEIVAVVSGFPSAIAALKFEWAMQNPHLSLHIPPSSRITKATQKKRSGRPRRPIPSLASIVPNLHLLLRVPSFARWPLKLHFFSPDLYASWSKWCATVEEKVPDALEAVTDFGSEPARERANEGAVGTPDPVAQPWGIHALPLDYEPMKEYVAKTQSIFSFEREGQCGVCDKHQPTDGGLYAACPHAGCETVGHVVCWGQRFLANEKGDEVMPVSGSCPKCGGHIRWGDMMKEMTLRLRGQKEIEKLLEEPRKRKPLAKGKAKSTKAEDKDGSEDGKD